MGTNSAALLHVISPFHATECQSAFCPYDQAQSVAIGSMLQAKEAFWQGSVTLAAAVLEKEMEVAVPRGFHALPALTRTTETEYKNLKPSKSLPFFQDIVDRVLDDDELTFDYLVYTNSDIILHENFYRIVQQQIELHGYDFFTINRRTVSKGKEELYTAADLDKIFSEKFESHPGTDCFVIKRSIVEKLDLQDVFIGTLFFANSLLLQARFHSVKYASFKSTDLQATYHLGDDREWNSAQMEHYMKQNGMNAICENEFFKTVCSSNNLPLPEGVGRECRKLESKMQKKVDESYQISDGQTLCRELSNRSIAKKKDGLVHSSNKVKFIFALGVEGTGHHFLAELEGKSKLTEMLKEKDLRSLQDQVAQEIRTIYQLKDLDDLANDVDHRYALIVDKIAALRTLVEAKITPLLPSDQTITLHLNTIDDIMSSFPGGHHTGRNTQIPDLGILYQACGDAGVDCGHIIMGRDAHEVIRSTTVNREFSSSRKQIVTLTMHLNMMISQAIQYPEKLVGCFDYNEPLSLPQHAQASNLFGWDIQDGSLLETLDSLYSSPQGMSAINRHVIVPQGFELYMGSMIRATDMLKSICREQLLLHELKQEQIPVNKMMLSPPFKIVQIGAPRTGSTFQFQLLAAIASLKSPHGANIESGFISKSDWKEGRAREMFTTHDSFVFKTHIADPSLQEALDTGEIALFSSSDIVPHSLYTQNRTTLERCSECEIEKYRAIFDLSDDEIGMLKQHMHDFEILRQCCGLQMSKYEVLRLNGCDVSQYIYQPDYPHCESHDLATIEASFANSPIPFNVNSPEYNWEKPGDCARFNADVSLGKGFNGRTFDSCEITGKFVGRKGDKQLEQETKAQNMPKAKKAGTEADKKPNPPPQLSPILKDYIKFHRSATQGGQLQKGVKYVIYECTEASLCGGIGDRIIGMVKALYLAICTNRVLLIDSNFPTPLENHLLPNLLQWNVTFPSTASMLDDFDEDIQLSGHEDVVGYRLGRPTGLKRHRLSTVFDSNLMAAHMAEHGYHWDISFAERFHQGFWALFRLSDDVLARSQEIKDMVGLDQLPYVGLHHREGDTVIPGVRAAAMTGKRGIGSAELVECFSTIKTVFPEKVQLAYLASDDNETKEQLSSSDSNIRATLEVNIFHLDKSTRTETSVGYKFSEEEKANGALDGWAELAVLVDSDCLVIDNSMYTTTAYYIRGPDACNVHVWECNADAVREHSHLYDYEPGDFSKAKQFKKRERLSKRKLTPKRIKSSKEKEGKGSQKSSKSKKSSKKSSQTPTEVPEVPDT